MDMYPSHIFLPKVRATKGITTQDTYVASVCPKFSSLSPYEVVITVGGVSSPCRKVIVSSISGNRSALLVPPPTERKCTGIPVASPMVY
jgi:hypothetical protein